MGIPDVPHSPHSAPSRAATWFATRFAATARFASAARLASAAAAAAVLGAACGPTPTPPGPPSAGEATAVSDREHDQDQDPRPLRHTPVGPLPAAAPLTTVGPDGELVDPVESLQALLDAGEIVFSHDSVTGWLPSVLATLDIPVSSQALVFSATSLQATRIAPWVPRAIYFNDDVYVGYVAEDVIPMDERILEIASIDPDDGGVFYFLSQDPEQPPRFVREGQTCLQCHEAGITEDVPGVMVRSVLTDRNGYPIHPLQDAATTDRTPMDRRFAGWYVTGTGGGPHGGNVWSPDRFSDIDLPRRAAYADAFDYAAGADVTRLAGRFDTSIYLSEHSDFVALLVLAHQTRIHNLITAAHERTEGALRDQEAARVTRGVEVAEGELLPTTEVAIDAAVERLVREMLFSGAVPLDGPISGTSGFARDFSARGPFDAEGRSLRDFDLETRLFRYPLSFLVYSDAFDALPPIASERVYARFEEILTGTDRSPEYEHLDGPTRAAIHEILLATKSAYTEAVGSG